jgi:glycine cleavage system transcriptional repressor
VRTFALSAIGADRPGIIAAVADRLVPHGVNVTDSHMGILRGVFAMTLLVTAPDDVDEDRLAADLQQVAGEQRLDGLLLYPVHEPGPADSTEPTHVVHVHGSDHPGILAAVTGSMAAAGVNVCDLRTRLSDAGVWVMVIWVSVPAAADPAAVEAALQTVGEREGVDVTLQPADADVL